MIVSFVHELMGHLGWQYSKRDVCECTQQAHDLQPMRRISQRRPASDFVESAVLSEPDCSVCISITHIVRLTP